MINLPIYDMERCTLFALGRNAMYAAGKILNLKPEDEVLTPAFDCDGSLQPFSVLGVKLRFFRSDPYTFSVDIDDIRRKITSQTKLIHVVNHFGVPQPWDDLLSLRKDAGIPILEDNAYSLFSKIGNRLFGTFGDASIFSLRKNLPLIDGGLLRISNPDFVLENTKQHPRWCYPVEYAELLRMFGRKSGLTRRIKKFLPLRDPPPPLYSEDGNKYPDWPLRDVIGREFSCDYLRPMSKLARRQLTKFSQDDFIDIAEKKRQYYNYLSPRLNEIEGIKVLWSKLPDGVVPFCVSCLVDSRRDTFLEVLRKKYEVMAWPTLSKLVLEQLELFPEISLLGRKLLQINLSANRIRSTYFPNYLEDLLNDMRYLSRKCLLTVS